MRPTIDPFAYINRYYGLSLRKHAPVLQSGKSTTPGKRGQVVKADGAYIFIQWDGEPKPQGPYHPTYELIYQEPTDAR